MKFLNRLLALSAILLFCTEPSYSPSSSGPGGGINAPAGDITGTNTNPIVTKSNGIAFGTAAFQPTTAFDAAGAAAAAQAASDPSGAASTVKSYFTGQTGYLNCNGTGCTAATAIPTTALSGSVSLANGGYVAVTGITYNSTAAATANTTAIQNALNNGGHVVIECIPGAIFYTSGHVTVSSNTDFEINRGCTWRQANGSNDNMIVNAAAKNSFTTLWDQSGIGSNGPLSLAWNYYGFASWAASTAYVKQAYSINNGNIYWQSTTSCTSASSGGPSGTGSGITDGTCSWNYVTATSNYLQGYYYTNANQFALVHFPNHGLSVGSYVFITPKPDYTYFWSGTKTAPAVGGPADSRFFGVFYVAAVNDSNYITIELRALPSTSFTGIPLDAKAADDNIKIGGGATLDYNSANNGNSANTNNINSSIVMSGVHNLIMDNLNGINSYNFFVQIAGVSGLDVGHVQGGSAWTSSLPYGDQIKVYGPAFDAYVHDESGYGTDDVLSFQTEDVQASQAIISAGDIINATARNIHGVGGYAVTLWPSHFLLKEQNILFDDVGIFNTGGNAAPIRVGSATGPVSDWTVENSRDRQSNSSLISFITIATGGTNQVVLDNIKLINDDIEQPNTGLFSLNASSTANIVLNDLSISHTRYVSATSYGAVSMNTTSGEALTINNLVMDDDYFTSTTGGQVFSTGSAGTITLGRISLTNSYINGFSTLFSTNIAGDFTASGNHIVTAGSVLSNTNANAVLHFNNNTLNGGTVVSYPASSGGVSLYSDGTNALSGGATWFTNPANATATIVHGWDVQCDVTKLSRITGEYCQNTNTAPGSGTLTTAGPVMDQGTSSLSWFLLSNPSGQQY